MEGRTPQMTKVKFSTSREDWKFKTEIQGHFWQKVKNLSPAHLRFISATWALFYFLFETILCRRNYYYFPWFTVEKIGAQRD